MYYDIKKDITFSTTLTQKIKEFPAQNGIWSIMSAKVFAYVCLSA